MARIPPQLIGLLKELEGLRLEVYLDQAGHPTIGWGHRILPGEAFTTITEAEALALLMSDTEWAANHVDRLVGPQLNDNQFSACVSLTFNIGVGAFNRSSVLRYIRADNFLDAAKAFLLWDKVTIDGELVVSNGLARRRAREKALFEEVCIQNGGGEAGKLGDFAVGSGI